MRNVSPVAVFDLMKAPDSSATYCVPPTSPIEERTGRYRLASQREGAPAGEAGELSSEPRIRVSSEPPISARPLVATRHQRILIGCASEAVVKVFLPIISALDAAVVKVDRCSSLERALSRRGPFDLVLSDSLLPGGTGLGILAGMCRSGYRPPFVLVQSIHDQLVRVVVGGGKSGVLSTRVVNDMALLELVQDLLGMHDSPASSRRSQRTA